jgi:hypothetical protein
MLRYHRNIQIKRKVLNLIKSIYKISTDMNTPKEKRWSVFPLRLETVRGCSLT